MSNNNQTMPKTKQVHKEGHTLNEADKQKDISERGDLFIAALAKLQKKHQMIIASLPKLNPNGTIGTTMELRDQKYLPVEAQA